MKIQYFNSILSMPSPTLFKNVSWVWILVLVEVLVFSDKSLLLVPCFAVTPASVHILRWRLCMHSALVLLLEA